MALNLDTFRMEVNECLREGKAQDLEYVLLKIAMEL